jgi:hypothetical protein
MKTILETDSDYMCDMQKPEALTNSGQSGVQNISCIIEKYKH